MLASHVYVHFPCSSRLQKDFSSWYDSLSWRLYINITEMYACASRSMFVSAYIYVKGGVDRQWIEVGEYSYCIENKVDWLHSCSLQLRLFLTARNCASRPGLDIGCCTEKKPVYCLNHLPTISKGSIWLSSGYPLRLNTEWSQQVLVKINVEHILLCFIWLFFFLGDYSYFYLLFIMFYILYLLRLHFSMFRLFYLELWFFCFVFL